MAARHLQATVRASGTATSQQNSRKSIRCLFIAADQTANNDHKCNPPLFVCLERKSKKTHEANAVAELHSMLKLCTLSGWRSPFHKIEREVSAQNFYTYLCFSLLLFLLCHFARSSVSSVSTLIMFPARRPRGGASGFASASFAGILWRAVIVARLGSRLGLGCCKNSLLRGIRLPLSAVSGVNRIGWCYG